MKNIFKTALILLAMGGVACTTGLEEEINVNNVGGSTTLSVDIAAPTTKTSLGDRTDDNKYPVYWSEEDCISINGYASQGAVINPSNPRSATFTVPKVLDYPYNILYPAATSQRVTFAATQQYEEGSFDATATPMYGYANSAERVQLSHLCGILRFNFKGSATLSSMVVTAGEGYITGDYAIDCSTGALSDGQNVSNTVEYSFGSGLKLSEEAQPFFLALPAGEYGVCLIELRSTSGLTMRLRFNSTGTNSIKAGVVKEFQTLTYKGGAECELSYLTTEDDELIIDNDATMTVPEIAADGWLVIDTPQDLRWLSCNAPLIDGVQYKKLRVANDIDCKYISISSLNLYEGSEMDGGSHTISNLQLSKGSTGLFGDVVGMTVRDICFKGLDVAPQMTLAAGVLFGTTKGTVVISNVTLHSCVVAAPYRVGMVAGALFEGDYTFNNVKIEGGAVTTTYTSGVSGAAGAFAGYVGGEKSGTSVALTARFTGCTAATEIKAYKEAADRPSARMIGVVGGYSAEEQLHFTECDASAVKLTALENSEPFVSRYTEEHRAEWCAALEARNSGFIGDEQYCRAEITFDGNGFAPQWDGSRSIAPLKGVGGEILIYSPADLASQQGKSLTGTMLFKRDIDLGGHKFKPINYVRTLDGEEHSLYNLKVVRTHDAANNRGAAFIIYASGQTIHKNLTFVGADILCEHDATIPNPAYGVTDDNGAGNAYAGTLVSRSWRSAITDADGNTTGYTTYTISNVHARNGKVRGVCKVGGLVGALRGHVTMDNCSVDGYQVENYTPNVPNYYLMKKSKDGVFLYGDLVIEGLQWWYTHGECGGLIGFAECHSADITNCSVTNTNLDCTGQPNKEVVANIWKKASYVEGAFTSGASITGGAKTTVAGRHVNQFIGDMRSRRTEAQAEAGTGEYTFNILDYTVSGNTYGGVAAESTNDYNHNYASGKYCDIVGCAYYVGVDINVIANIHVSECAGTLTFRPKGGEAVTLTEAVGSGSNLSWFGGASSGVSLTGYTSYYPTAPTE